MESREILIIGAGYAGLAMAYRCWQEGLHFKILGDLYSSASAKSAGMVNPVILKRFTPIRKAEEMWDFFSKEVALFEQNFGVKIFNSTSVERVFHDEKETQTWQKKAKDLASFLTPEIETNQQIFAPYGVGRVQTSGRLLVATYLAFWQDFLSTKNYCLGEHFEYSYFNPESCSYQGKEYAAVFFCEGIGIQKNPYFHWVDIRPNKGHFIQLDIPFERPMEHIVKNKYFLYRNEDDSYYYGGTYDREDISLEVCEEKVLDLKQNAVKLLPVDSKVLKADFGFRATTKDRMPILGQHPLYQNLYILNGMGARGVLNSFYYSKVLIDFYLHQKPIPKEVEVSRFWQSS